VQRGADKDLSRSRKANQPISEIFMNELIRWYKYTNRNNDNPSFVNFKGLLAGTTDTYIRKEKEKMEGASIEELNEYITIFGGDKVYFPDKWEETLEGTGFQEHQEVKRLYKEITDEAKKKKKEIEDTDRAAQMKKELLAKKAKRKEKEKMEGSKPAKRESILPGWQKEANDIKARRARRLAPNWEETHDDKGEKYYYNSITQDTSSWRPVVDPKSKSMYFWHERTGAASYENPDEGLPSGWQAEVEDGHIYYYNKLTDEALWDKPSV
jgi:hypothetical protein